MSSPSDRRYTKDHEWVKVTGGKAQVGISNFAQGELGDVVFVDLPKTGKKVSRGDVLCVVESTKAASDVYAPISGEVAEVNATLSSNPEKINASPYEEGWIAVINPSNIKETEDLFTSEQYDVFTKSK